MNDWTWVFTILVGIGILNFWLVYVQNKTIRRYLGELRRRPLIGPSKKIYEQVFERSEGQLGWTSGKHVVFHPGIVDGISGSGQLDTFIELDVCSEWFPAGSRLKVTFERLDVEDDQSVKA